MPHVLTVRGYTVKFYSADQSEPPHVHVQRGGAEVKVWLNPLAVAENRGLNERQVRQVLEELSQFNYLLEWVWHAYFRGYC